MENNTSHSLKCIGTKSTVQQIVDAILNEIMLKHWKPGDKIPTEFELADLMHVSRNSVREAVKILDAMGILEIRRSDGTYVASEFSSRMLDPLIYSLVLEQDKSKNLYELRRAIESGAVVLAAENSLPQDIENITNALDVFVSELRKDPPDVHRVLAADIHFHDVIMQATHNQLFQRINSSITTVTYSARIETLTRNFKSADEIDFLIETHKEIVKRIISPSTDNVSDLIAYSLSNWKETLKQH